MRDLFTDEEMTEVVAFVEGLPGAVAAVKALLQYLGPERAVKIIRAWKAEGATAEGVWLKFKHYDPPAFALYCQTRHLS